MSEMLPGGVELVRFGGPLEPPNATQTVVLRSTVSLLPVAHLAVLSRIEARRPNQPPVKGGGNDPRNKITRLSSVSFSESKNSQVNITFLHEMGHIVDYYFRVTEEVRRMANDARHPLRADAADLLTTPHTGATHGPGETIADCYMVLFRSLRVSRPYVSQACPTQYLGNEGQRRFRVLLATSAFRNITIDQLLSDSDAASFDRLIRSLG